MDYSAVWRAFDSSEIPEGYGEPTGSQLCQVYLPDDCLDDVRISEVKDLSLHPRLGENNLLVTPVVSITPHGLRFSSSKPAIVILSHCTRTEKNYSQSMNLVPMCSSTGRYQAPEWTSIGGPDSMCEMFDDCIMFTTYHFSLFAVISSYPYPSSCMGMQPGVGGELLIPELPGFSLHIPNDSVRSLSEPVNVRGTVYYCDKSYAASHSHAFASACIGMEPHGMEFDHPVQITIPIPDFTDVRMHFPDAKLELWCSQAQPNSDAPTNWERVEGAGIQFERSDNSEVARFMVRHFSWFELLWSICISPLQRLGLGAASIYGQLASRSRYIAVRFQAFMSHFHGVASTFGLVVIVYKFGEPITVPSNYPLLVADSGAKRMYLRAGDLHVKVEGCFVPNQDVGEILERDGKILDYTGEDFCERFEFALNLKSDVSLPLLQEGQVLGKLHFIQWEESRSIDKSYNLIMPYSCTPTSTRTNAVSPAASFQTLADFTPPRSPEPDHCWPTAYGDHTPSSHSSGSAFKGEGHAPLRKRTRRDSLSFPDLAPKRQILVRDSEISDRVLMSISHRCGCKFMDLGISLGLDYQTIANRVSRLEGRPEHLKVFEVLQEWKARGASYEGLARALEDTGMNAVALKYCYSTENVA